ncbi:hypothetical protein ACHHYP_01640 [Achlya hypogyna]|uniref:WW domain-containing protein n=1 Tax=Achlya hypogyna TaxID=1202772 RepID=A0A1V9Z883_ACHHY|nr:hypothetical protein ACHHYP_01640 [Achlya hypogyna]
MSVRPSPYGASALSKKRKLVRNEASLAPLPLEAPPRKLTMVELEEKKTLLPYLEKIEYINAQLRARGLDVARVLPHAEPNQAPDALPVASASLSSRSEPDEHEPLTLARLRQRYPRFCGTAWGVLRERPAPWLLKLVDDIYDAYYAAYLATHTLSSFAPFVLQHLATLFGVAADQETVDVAYNVERLAPAHPPLLRFAAFLREIEDDELALFHGHVRAHLQAHLGLSLHRKEKVRHPDDAKKVLPPGSVVLADHPRLRDGTQVVYVGKPAVVHALQAACFPRETTLARFYGDQLPFRDAVTVGPGGDMTQPVLGLDGLLDAVVADLHRVPEDIVAKHKFNDDGESLALLSRLQDTISHDTGIAASKAALDREIPALRRLLTDRIKLDRTLKAADDTTKAMLKTRSFLLDNQILAKTRDVDDLRHRVNAVWASVLADAAAPAAAPKSPRARILARFRDAVVRRHHNHVVEQQVAAKLLQRRKKGKQASAWSDQLDALQERSAVRIQRLFRQRRAWRRDRHAAQTALAERRHAHKKRKAEREMERRRLEALRARDAEKHRARLAEKGGREAAAAAARAAQEKAVLSAAATAQAEKQFAAASHALAARIFRRWVRFVTIAQRTAQAYKTSLAGRFKRWRGYAHFRRRLHTAATAIQAAYRGHAGRKAGHLVRRRALKKQQLAVRSVQRLRQRFLFALLRHWRAYTDQQLVVKARCRALVRRSLAGSFAQWAMLLQRRRASAALLQRVLRGYWGRRRAAAQRRLLAATVLVQRTYRGHLGRRVAAVRRRLCHAQHRGAHELLQRLLRRSVWRCFRAWLSRVELRHVLAAREADRLARRRRWCFGLWQSYRVYRQLKRAELQRRQFVAATRIQRSVRGFLARRRFRTLVAQSRAATVLQRAARGYLTRQFYRRTLAVHRSALAIQCGWRRRKAILTATRRRNAFTLDAALRGDYSVVLRAFTTGRAAITDDAGNSLLHLACLGGSKRVIKLCLRYQMDINGTNAAGRTPLHVLVAAPHGHRATLLDYLIDHGAWHEAKDAAGDTPLLAAAALGHVDCLRTLLQRAAAVDVVSATTGLTPLATAVTANFTEAAATLLEIGRCSANATDSSDGASLLHDAAAHGYVAMAQLLVTHGAAVDAVDADGSTPVMYAVHNDHEAVLRFLLEAGARPDVANAAGLAAVHLAIAKPALAGVLAAFGADVNLPTAEGETPLHLSCRSDDLLDSSRVLLSFGAAVDAKNRRGNLPAHLAARMGAAQTMELLIEYGANMNMRNFDNKNPLGEARMHHRLAVVAVIQYHFAQDMQLLEAAAEPVVDEDGVALPDRTPDEWMALLPAATVVSRLNEWAQCIDSTTGAIFYHDADADLCSWRAPVEYQAALGTHWHPMACSDGSYVYAHDVTGDVSATVPPIDPLRLQALVQGVDEFKMLRSRIHKVSSETAAATAQYRSFWSAFDAETKEARTVHRAAVAIQRTYLGHLYRRRLRALKLEHKTARHLQRVYRGRLARREAARQRNRVRQATAIQAVGRGFLVRLHERQYWHQWRLDRRRARLAAVTVQRSWRGMHGRWRAKRVQVVKTGPRSFFEWAEARKHATLVGTFQVWQELQLANTPPVVGSFYCNHITGQCVWDKPPAWLEHDYLEFLDRQQLYYYGYTAKMLRAALVIQSQFRARTARVYFRRLLEGVRLARGCERAYMEEPTSLSALGNYALYLHALLHDYARAGLMYGHLVDLMAARGPDVPFILRCYAIFLFVTAQDERDTIALLVARADKIDPRKRKFELAFLGFFRHSVVLFPESAQSHVNYASCLDWVYGNVDGAIKHYLRALALDPHNGRIVDLFNATLDRHGLLEAGDASERFMRHQADTVAKEDTAARQAFEAAEEAAARTAAAILIQTRYRGRKGKQSVQALQLARRLAKHARPKSALETTLEAAFSAVAAGNRGGKTIRLAQLGSVYEKLGLPFRAADEDVTYASYFREFDYPETITLTRFLKWWTDGAAPDAWEACTSDEGYVYYYNRSTGASVWDRPRFRRELGDTPTAAAWEECRTADGTPYYVNARTGVSSWENPASALPPWEAAVDDTGRVYFYNHETGAAVWTLAETTVPTPAPADPWELVQTDDGVEYYYNRLTGATSWTRPADDWEQLTDDAGNVYYYNRDTEASQRLLRASSHANRRTGSGSSRPVRSSTAGAESRAGKSHRGKSASSHVRAYSENLAKRAHEARSCADKQAVQDDTERPHVRLASVVAAVALLQHLRRHVVRRSNHGLKAAAGRRLGRCGVVVDVDCELCREAEVGDLEHVVLAQKQVFGLEIAVHDAEVVAVGNTREQLGKVALGLGFGHPDALGLDAVEQFATGGQFQHEEDGAFGRLHVLEHVVELKNIGVAQATTERMTREPVHKRNLADPCRAVVNHGVGRCFDLERVVVQVRVEWPKLRTHLEGELFEASRILDAWNELVLVWVEEPPYMLFVNVQTRRRRRCWRVRKTCVHDVAAGQCKRGE